MKQYVHSFYTTNDFTTFTNSNNYHEPFVSDTFETNKVNYNLRKKLVFNILTNGYINWKCSDNSVSKRLYYIINDGQENYISSSTSGNKINVSAGDTVTIWSDTFTCSESLSKYNTFEGTTCNFSVEGNINALINTLTKTSLDNKDYIYANLFKNCTTLKSIQKIYLPVKDFGAGAFYQTFYGCTGIENNIFPLTIISCKEQTFYQTFYNCSSLTNSNNFILNLSEVPTSCFEETFYGCSNLTTIPKINVINLGESSFKGLFKNCISLQEIDNIQINKISSSSFEEMFYGCTELSNINFDLNFGYVYDSSYKRMFYGCTSLQKSPNIGVLYIDEEVVEDPFYEMFYNCSSLNTIYISSYEGETENMFTSWVKNVSSTGVFYKSEDNSNWTIGINGIPTGWTSNEENYKELPLTFLFLEDGKFTINTSNISGINKLSYKLNSNEIKNINIQESQKIISVNCGDKIQLFGNAEFVTSWRQGEKFSSTANCKIFGNLLSLSYSQTFYIHYLNNEPSILVFYYLFYKFTNLISAKNLIFPDTIDSRNSYGCMFYSCSTLQYSPKILPALNLNEISYGSMFYGCNSLLTIPLLPATTLSNDCYSSMFYNCRSLVSLPSNFTLPATTLTSSCYYQMFYGCSSLTSLPANFTLPATTLASSCYSSMFYNCSSLASLPEGFTLSATTLESNCYYQMFYGCSSLTLLPSNFILPATTLSSNCYYYMFAYCGLTSLPANFTLPATTLASYCYENMFYSCASLTSLPTSFTLPATNLETGCYRAMFSRCGLTSLPANFILPATTLTSYCYYLMFNNCSSLVSLPEDFTLPATNLASNCYQSMFSSCSSLASLPDNFTLPATTLASSCYNEMFYNCSSLASLPDNFTLPATTLASYCYSEMFYGCSSLVSLPEDFTLPATTLSSYCYQSMFYGCSSLVSLPDNFTLPATSLVGYCYEQMFYECSKLVLPTNFTLPATHLANYCYRNMFYNCSKVNKMICFATTNINSSNSTTNWLSGVSSSGIFYKDVNTNWPRSVSGIPTGWTIYSYLDDSKNYILKGNNIFNITKRFNTISNVTIYYKNSYTYQIENSLSWILNIETIDSTNTGNDNFSSISISFDISENNTNLDRSGSFSINFYNNSILIDTLQIIINQGIEDTSHEVILLPSGSSYGWQNSNLRGPNNEIIYYSANNGSASSTAKMQIRLSGYTEFTIKVATNGESSCDYVIVSELDATPTSSSSIHGSTGNEWSGSGKTSSKSSVSSYNTLTWYTVSYSNITTSSHTITIIYIKDSSVDKFTDRGYIYIPN